jgi:hypothetical protein
VADDELSAPLGQNAKKKPRAIRLPIALSQAIAAVLGAFVLTWISWALFVTDPLGGEPVAVVGPMSLRPSRHASRSRRCCRPRSTGSRNGPRPPRTAASCWCP